MSIGTGRCWSGFSTCWRGDGRYQWYFRSPDGERYDAFATRLAEWRRGWSGPGVRVVVTHGIVSRVLRGLYAGLPHEVALMLPVPQDKVFRLSGGFIEELPVLGSPAPDPGEKLRGATDKGRSR